MKIDFGGSLSKGACSRSSPSLAPWLAPKVVVYYGRVCGRLRLLQGRLFLRGQQP